MNGFREGLGDGQADYAMNSSVRNKLPPGAQDDGETRAEKLRRIRDQVNSGYYASRDVMRDVADALIMNPAPFEALNEKNNGNDEADES